MKRHITSRLATVLMVAALLFVGHPKASAMVLCVGLDGHVDVEAYSGGKCAPETDAGGAISLRTRQISETEHVRDRCGECIDVPIAIGNLDTRHPKDVVDRTEIRDRTQVRTPYVNALDASERLASARLYIERTVRKSISCTPAGPATSKGFGSSLLLI